MNPGLAVAVPLAAAAAVLLLARAPRLASGFALAAAVLTTGLTAAAAAAGATLRTPWVPSWGAELHMAADGLGSVLAVLAAGIGSVVVGYARAYMPAHLRARGRSARDEARFHALMLLFLASMIGLAYARDLVLLFVCFDVTALCSYFLIGFDRDDEEARRAALMAVVVTGVGSVPLLVGALVWHAATGSFDLATLADATLSADVRAWGAALVAVAALVKSAQVPFHFWLPRAMAAPTPVSAYLHSAAMVAAGVFVLLRIEPLLAGTPTQAALPYVGLLSIAVGSALALGADGLKQLLAYSTVAQYGYVVLLLGLGGETGVAGAALYLLAHALAKSALFLTAGAVTQVTGEDRLSRLGGLGGRMPVLAAASGVAAAALAGLPLTVGYFKDEALFEAALARGPFFAAAAVAAAALTLAYTARFWAGLFLGRPRAGQPARTRPRAGLVWPIAALALAALAGGVAPGRLAAIASAAGASARAEPTVLALHYGLGPTLAAALAAYALGAAIYLTRARWLDPVSTLHRIGRASGPSAWHDAALRALNHVSELLHDLEVRDLRDRIAAILVPAGVLVAAGLLFRIGEVEWRIGTVTRSDAPVILALLVVTVTALTALTRRTHLDLVITMTALGFTLAAVYALLAAPDLALVAVLVETTLTLLLLGAFGVIPTRALRRGLVASGRALVQRRRHRIAGGLAGCAAFVVTWSALSVRETGGVAGVYMAWSERVHASDPVSAILADFRGLDTAAETTVLAVAVLGLITLLGRSRA